MPTLREKMLEAIESYSFYTTGIADAVLALLDGPTVVVPGQEHSVCPFWTPAKDCIAQAGVEWCCLTQLECHADNCPGPGKYKLVRVD